MRASLNVPAAPITSAFLSKPSHSAAAFRTRVYSVTVAE